MIFSPMPSDLPAPAMRRVPCPLLDGRVNLPERPRRIVSFVSGLTEAIWEMGLEDRVVGVSQYCARYVDTGTRSVAGDYLQIDEKILTRLQPDLVILTAGVQLGVARNLARAGWPVFVFPLPESFGGILENIRRLGALLGEMGAAHELVDQMTRQARELAATAPVRRPRVYAELWFGRHVRMTGGLTFIHDLLQLAGGENVLGRRSGGYLAFDQGAVEAARPEVIVMSSEEDDHLVNVPQLLAERGWPGRWPFAVVEAGIKRGRNVIHDGPSFLETARWLRAELDRVTLPQRSKL
jgi:iron complex transport system substrate-binding protein